MSKVTLEELETLRSLNTSYQQTRSRIADVAIAHHTLHENLSIITENRNSYSIELGQKYGSTAMINLENGDITHKIPESNGKDSELPTGQ